MIKIRQATIARLRDRLKDGGTRPSLVVTSAGELLARCGLLPIEEAAALNVFEPVIEAMFLMMVADGELADDERSVIRGAVRELGEGYVRSATLDVLLDNYTRLLLENGVDARLDDVARRLRDDPARAESAFVMAAAVAYADHKVEDPENVLLNRLADAVGISDARANELLDELENDWRNWP